MRGRALLISLAAAAWLLVPAAHVGALGPCTPPGAPPACDGGCPFPGEACVDAGGFCECLPTIDPCGALGGPPLCLGECPPTLICADVFGVCNCVPIPTLSEWGIIGMSFVMLGGVLFLRRRRQSA